MKQMYFVRRLIAPFSLSLSLWNQNCTVYMIWRVPLNKLLEILKDVCNSFLSVINLVYGMINIRWWYPSSVQGDRSRCGCWPFGILWRFVRQALSTVDIRTCRNCNADGDEIEIRKFENVFAHSEDHFENLKQFTNKNEFERMIFTSFL